MTTLIPDSTFNTDFPGSNRETYAGASQVLKYRTRPLNAYVPDHRTRVSNSTGNKYGTINLKYVPIELHVATVVLAITSRTKLDPLLVLLNSAAQEAIAEYERMGGVPSTASAHPLDAQL